MSRNIKVRSEEHAIEILAAHLGKSWRDRVVTYLSSETSPITSSDFAESLDITVQNSTHCLQALRKVDLVSTYHRRSSTGALQVAGGAPKPFYLLGTLQDYDRDEFIGVNND